MTPVRPFDMLKAALSHVEAWLKPDTPSVHRAVCVRRH